MDLYNLIISAKLSKGEGGDVSVDPLSVTENGTYTASSGHAYSPVTVNVPNSYTESDEGKVVDNGALVGQTSTTKTANGTYDTTLNDEVVVNVPSPSGSISITQNGTVDVTNYASANVNVSGGGGDAQFAALCDGSITSAIVPEGVTSLKTGLFSGCLSLQSVSLPSTLTSIGGTALYSTGLTSLTIPEGVTSAASYAFGNNANLVSIDLPSTIQDVGGYFLKGCTALTTLTIRALTPPTIDKNSLLYDVNNNIQAIYVPAAAVNAYKNKTIWMNNAAKIQAIPE